MIEMNVTKTLKGASGPFTLTMQLDIATGSFVSFFGASGAGKTTALRMLAGLTAPDSGEITVNGVPWFNSVKRINLPAKNRNIGFVFQDYALFPTMTVRKNIEYAAEKNREAVEKVIDVMGLRPFERNHPDKLSGGQRQRVALARALVRQPDILLLDEPLSALDHELRSALQDEICEIHRRFNLTSVIVTHDITEIYKMSTAVAVFEGGNIVKTGSPEHVFGNNLSTKFRVVGKVVALQCSEVATVITVQVGGNQTKVVVDTSESHLYSVGQSVVLAAKAFVPVVFPLT